MATLIDNTKRQGQAAEGVEKSTAKATSPSTPQSLYVAREQIYPKKAKGAFRRLKWVAMIVLLGIYYIVPWIRWDRGPGQPDQAVLIDFENARFYFFFIEIWPQEIYYVTGLLILAALGLFLITALFGRVWCGYACPQTIWTDLFIAVERFFEGDRNARIKLNRAPMNISKFSKKVGKHTIWFLIAFATGGAWILYFHDAPIIFRDYFTGHAPATAYIFSGLLTFTTYTLAGTMREQVCTYMCPWPRIQAAMIDEKALNVTYRYDRGEPRGAHKKGTSWDGRGDCIDCHQCVAVCPVGIDIRNGLQLECIGCALCIDACNDIMGKIDRPKGLIAYDTDANIKRRLEGEKSRYELIRPRTVIYAILFLIVGSIMLYSLLNRSTLDVNILRDRQPNFVTLSDGSIRNGYTIKILNKAAHPRTLKLSVTGLNAPTLTVAGHRNEDEHVFTVPADETQNYKIYLAASVADKTSEKIDIELAMKDIDTDEITTGRSVFVTGNN